MRFLLCLFAICALAAEDRLSILPQGKVINGDYFARGSTVEISGTVNGDVYILGGQVFIDGTINGNVLMAGGSVSIEGSVSQNVRVASGQIAISGPVGGNVTVLAGTLKLLRGGEVGGSAVVLAGNADLGATIRGDLYVGTSSLRIADQIDGDVTAYVNQMRVTSKADIRGQLEYWSNTDAVINSSATIEGGTIHHPSFFYTLSKGKVLKGFKIGSTLLPILMNFLYTLALGLILMRYFPQSVKRATNALKDSPLHTFLAGIVVLVLLPLIALLFLMTILGAPFAITLIAVNIFAFYTAKIFVILWLGKLILPNCFERHRRFYYTIGLLVYFALTVIPYVGDVFSVAAMLFGLGAMVRGRMIEFENKERSS